MDKIILARNLFNTNFDNINNIAFYNLSGSILVNSIKKIMDKIIAEYHYMSVIEFEHIKNVLLEKIIQFKQTQTQLQNVCIEIMYLVSHTYYPYQTESNYSNISKSPNKFKLPSIKWHHKANSLEIKTNYSELETNFSSPSTYGSIVEELKFSPNENKESDKGPDKELDEELDEESDEELDEIKWNIKQRKTIKNKTLSKNKILFKMQNGQNKISSEEKENFIGKLNYFDGSKCCYYCEKYISEKYFLPENNTETKTSLKKTKSVRLNCCIHCWAWLNCNDVDLENGIYYGDLNQNVVFEYIKHIVPIHKEIGCTNINCIFNIYDKLLSNSKLNKILCTDVKSNKSDKIDKSELILQEYQILSKDVKFNWKKSYICM